MTDSNEFNINDLIKYHQTELGIARQMGSGNKCPHCKRKGDFKSIYRVDAGDCVFMICGWCRKVTKLPISRWNKK